MHRHGVTGREFGIHRREGRGHQRQRTVRRRDNRCARRDRIRVTIEREHARALPEHRLGITTRPEGRVDMGLAGGNGERIEHFGKQDRHMRRVVHRSCKGHSAIPFCLQWKRHAACITGSTSVAAISVAGSQISIQSNVPQKKAYSPIPA